MDVVQALDFAVSNAPQIPSVLNMLPMSPEENGDHVPR
jgi:hypothetical protein